MRVTPLRLLLALLLLCGVAARADAVCTATSSGATFTPAGSYTVAAGSVAQTSGAAGLTCPGATLSLLGGPTAKATFTTANNFVLKSSTSSDTISFQLFADQNAAQPIVQNTTLDYANASLLSLLGLTLGGSNSFSAPIYVRLLGNGAGMNVAAGRYTDQLTVAWNYNICSGVNVAGLLCLGYETGKVNSILTITLDVSNDCKIVAPNVDLGSVALASQFTQKQGNAMVDCTKGSVFKVTFSQGQNAFGGWRAMKNSAATTNNLLQYNIYHPDGTVWNDVTNAGTGTGSTTATQTVSYLVKANTAQVTPTPGSYSDTVSLIVSF